MLLARKVTTVGAATLASRLLGFLRDALLAAVLGAGPLADAFVAAFQLPNLARRLIAEGALNAAFVPLWLKRQAEAGPDGARDFTEKVAGVLVAGLVGVAIVLALAMPLVMAAIAPGFEAGGTRALLAASYGQIAVAYVPLAGAIAVLAAVLAAQGRVAAAAALPIVFNLVMIAALCGALLGHAEGAPATGTLLAAAVVVAGFAQLSLIAFAARRLTDVPVRGRPRLSLDPAVAAFFRRVGPGVVAAGIPQLKLLAAVAIVSALPGAAAHLWYADRLYELPLGVVSAVVASVLVPLLAGHARDADAAALAADQRRAVELALALSMPAAAGLFVLAEPIARVLFERGAFGPADSAATAAVLAALAFGLPGHVLEKVFAAGAYAHHDTATPMRTALGGLALTVLGGSLLVGPYGAPGVAAAVAASGWVNALVLASIEIRRGRLLLPAAVWRFAAKVVAATAAMAAGVLAGTHALAGPLAAGTASRAVALAGLVVLGMALYGAVAAALGAADFRRLLAGLRRLLA